MPASSPWPKVSARAPRSAPDRSQAWPARLLLACVFCCCPAWAQLDVNHATEADLDSLRGVGPALTARILAQRTQAPFTDWADLMRRVKGMRPTTARHLADQGLTVNGQPLAPAASTEAR